MFAVIVLGATLAVAAGIIVKVALERTALSTSTRGRITGTELVIGTLLCSLLVIPMITAVGFSIARSSQTKYNEYWSGFEAAANVAVTACTRDGACRHTYQCDPYQVTETYTEQEPYTTTESYTRSDGTSGTRTVTKYRSVTKTRVVTKYHACPYVTHEYTYTVDDTLGETHTMGSHWFPEDPEQHLWRRAAFGGLFGERLPKVPTGQPASWVAAKARLDSGNPGGVTAVHTYKNFILASQDDIYAKNSAAIDAYRKDGLLPDPARGVRDYYQADKVHFIGTAPGAPAAWQEAVMRFNGALGGERQGDLHLVVVTDDRITNPDEYTHAMEAYWQSEALGRDTLSKNGLVVVLGSTDGRTVAWARGFTGMPLGNERLAVDVREDLVGSALTPAAILGTAKATISDGAASVAHTDGALEGLIFAEGGGFVRVEMADYEYLFAQIQPTGGQKVFIGFVGFLVALGVWAVMVAVDFTVPAPTRTVEAIRRSLRRLTPTSD